MSDHQPSRVPSGVPSGGQFATTTKPEAEVVLCDATTAQPEHLIYDTEEAFDAAFGQWAEAPDGSSYWEDWPLDVDPSIPIERVWTVVDGDSGAQWAMPGGHLVNRVAYIVTEKPWPHENIDGMVWDVSDDATED